MTFGVPATAYDVDPVMARVLDTLFVLHADHEQNCSTSTVRLVGSAHANLFASVSAGVNALFGPLHGGAAQAVPEMLERIQADGGDVSAFVRRVKNRDHGVRLMGFGHRVYKHYDPRATIVKEAAQDVMSRLAKPDPLLDIAMQLEEIALADDFFVSRKLYPNVDFYTGLIYKAMGFPTRMFPVLFALGRLPGWIAQWREMMADPVTKLGRPRQVYTGPAERPYVPMAERTSSTVARSGVHGRLRRLRILRHWFRFGGRGRSSEASGGRRDGDRLLVHVVGASGPAAPDRERWRKASPRCRARSRSLAKFDRLTSSTVAATWVAHSRRGPELTVQIVGDKRGRVRARPGGGHMHPVLAQFAEQLEIRTHHRGEQDGHRHALGVLLRSPVEQPQPAFVPAAEMPVQHRAQESVPSAEVVVHGGRVGDGRPGHRA
jgi:hypothetical protein